MYALKVVTTVLIIFMILIIAWFGKGFQWKNDKASIIGFDFMEVVYLLSLLCIWS